MTGTSANRTHHPPKKKKSCQMFSDSELDFVLIPKSMTSFAFTGFSALFLTEVKKCVNVAGACEINVVKHTTLVFGRDFNRVNN